MTAMALVSLAIGGCGVPTQSGDDNFQMVIAKDSAIRQSQVAACAARIERRAPSGVIQDISPILNVSAANTPRVFRKRTADAVAAKRVTFREFMAAERGSRSPDVMRTLKGR
ncbi:hypothetical protein [Ensifer soli]|uniref:hypothetical protein n=1 Tax=Ciceribacter sp. sgz301302 TaxID=3342379 RepID=UPI0035B6E76A